MIVTSPGDPSIGIWRGQVSVGRRPSPGAANGRRYSAISSSERPRKIAPGNILSTNAFCSRIIDSPDAERIKQTVEIATVLHKPVRVWPGIGQFLRIAHSDQVWGDTSPECLKMWNYVA